MSRPARRFERTRSILRSGPHPRRAALLLVLLAPLAIGCAFGEVRWGDPLEREYSLQEMQKRYTDLVRFGHFQGASRYVARAEQKSYLAGLPAPESIRFTDYRAEPVHVNEDLNLAVLEVTYTAYSPWTLVQFNVFERQEWRRPDGMANAWIVKSTFRGLEPYLAKKPKKSAKR